MIQQSEKDHKALGIGGQHRKIRNEKQEHHLFIDDALAVPEDKSHFHITVPVAVSQQFFGWVIGLGKSVRIVEPESVKKQMMKALADITERYEE